MLKAKSSSRMTKRKMKALKEIEKDDNLRGIFVRVSSEDFRKLHIELAHREMTLVEWVTEKIEEI